MATGTVKWFNESKGYGFITPDEKGEDLFAHFSAIKMDGFKTLKEGQRVSFEITTGPKGKQASNIMPLNPPRQQRPAAAGLFVFWPQLGSATPMSISLQDIRAAAAALNGNIVATPVPAFAHAVRDHRRPIVLKFENQQFTASFKERGALNKLLSLHPRAAFARRDRRIGRQPRARRRLSCQAAWHPGRHRHAALHAGSEGRSHARLRCGGHPAWRVVRRGQERMRACWRRAGVSRGSSL